MWKWLHRTVETADNKKINSSKLRVKLKKISGFNIEIFQAKPLWPLKFFILSA